MAAEVSSSVHYRCRAERLRFVLLTTQEPVAIARLRKIVDKYRDLADRAAQREKMWTDSPSHTASDSDHSPSADRSRADSQDPEATAGVQRWDLRKKEHGFLRKTHSR